VNITKLYTIESGDHTGNSLALNLTKTINTLTKKFQEQESKIVSTVIKGVCQVSWGPLPLFWMTDALLRLECGKVVEEKSVDLIMDLVEHHIVYQVCLLKVTFNARGFIFNTNTTITNRIFYPCYNNLLYIKKLLYNNLCEFHVTSPQIQKVTFQSKTGFYAILKDF
jgi:hypothetical protein